MVYIERIILIACSLGVIEASHLQPFHQQLLQAKIDLVKSFKAKRDVSPLNVNWNPLWTKSIENLNSALIQHVNNKMFILSKDTVYNLDGDIPSFKLVPIKSLQGLSNQVSFIESIEWNNILFLLLGFNNGQCRLMTATNEQDFSIRQTISNLDTPVEAEFFILNNELFVVIIFNQEDDTKVSVKIYRWRNTILDEEPPNYIKTVGAISVTTFTTKNSAILVIGQKTKYDQKISSPVLRMKSNGVIEKIQFLQTQDLVSMKHFTMANEQFLMVLEKNQSSTIYWWEGNEFVKWLSLPDIYGDFTLSIGYIRNNTLILLYKENVVAVYSMTWLKLNKVTMMGFLGQIVSAALYDGDKMYLVVVTKDEIMKIQLIELDINLNEEQSGVSSRNQKFDPILQCVKKLEESINMVEDNIRYLQQTLPNILYSNQPALVHKIKVLGEGSGINIESGTIKEVLLQNNDIKTKTQNIDGEIMKISNKTSLLEKSLQEEKAFPNSKILIFQNDLIIKEAKINTINTDVINNIPFNAEEIISLSKNQRLKSIIIAPVMNVEWLLTKTLQKKIVESLVPTNNTVEAPQFVSSLMCNNIETSSLINGINITNVVTKVMNGTFYGDIVVDDIIIKQLKTQLLNEVENVRYLLTSENSSKLNQLRLPDSTLIRNLNVNKINGIHIDDFLQSLVLQGENNTIKGNLYFRKGFRAGELIAEKLTTAVTTPSLNYISGDSLFRDVEGTRPKHDVNEISPDSKRKLIIYKGKVKIKGNLEMNALHFKNATLNVKNQSISISMDNIGHTFWAKHSEQTIEVPVTFVNGATVEGNLDILHVNQYELSNYDNTKPMMSYLKFQNISVSKFIRSGTLNNYKIPDFHHLNRSIVKEKGTYVVKGKKVFHNVHVDNLHAEEINGVSPTLAFTRKSIGGWKNIVVENLSVKGNINTHFLNNYNLSEKLTNLILMNENYTLPSATFQTLSGTAVNVNTLNGVDIDKIIQLIRLRDNTNKYNIYFNGSLHVPAIISTKSINKKQLANILPMIVDGLNPSTIKGKKTFKSQVTVENDITTSSLNGENFQSILDSRLCKSKTQNISGYYTIKNGKLQNLIADYINGVNVSNLIFIDESVIHIKSDVQIPKLIINSNLTSGKLYDNCFLPEDKQKLIFPHDIHWSSLYVHGDVQWKTKSQGKIQKIIDSAVIKNGNQQITGNVEFIQSSTVKQAEVKLINSHNVSFIWNDAMRKSEPNQVISGSKVFGKKISFSHGFVSKDLKIPIINKVNIINLMNKIILKNASHNIKGHKIFKNGFKSFKFISEGGVNGIKDIDIVTENSGGRLPYAVFSSLEIIDNLKVRNINNINLSKFVQSLVALDAKPLQTIKGQTVFKDSVQLMGESNIKNINSMNIADVMFNYDFQKTPQTITGCTNITLPPTIRGDFQVDRINRKLLKTTFKNAILDNESCVIHGDIVFENEQSVQSIYGKQYFLKDAPMKKFIEYNEQTEEEK